MSVDDDLFDDDFEFFDDADQEVDESETTDVGVDDAADDDAADVDVDESDKKAPPKRKKRPAAKGRRSKTSNKAPADKANADEPSAESDEAVADADGGDLGAGATEQEAAPSEPPGPPADHVVRIYQFGQLVRTIPREFTDADAVAFAEEYSRTSKAYGRLAIPAHQDDPPAESFADAAKQ